MNNIEDISYMIPGNFKGKLKRDKIPGTFWVGFFGGYKIVSNLWVKLLGYNRRQSVRRNPTDPLIGSHHSSCHILHNSMASLLVESIHFRE